MNAHHCCLELVIVEDAVLFELSQLGELPIDVHRGRRLWLWLRLCSVCLRG